MNYKQALTKAIKKFEEIKIQTPRLDAEVLLSHTLKKSREFILVHPEKKLTAQQLIKFNNFIKRRLKHEPIAYIIGEKEFYGLDFKVTRDTLIPRPETEHLVESTLNLLHSKDVTIIDIGTGSGNIIISLAKNLKNKNKYFGVDISQKALIIAKQNAKKHKINKKIKFIKSDLLNYFTKDNSAIKQFNNLVIIANLPYLDTTWKNLLKSSETKGLAFEPEIALYAGKDGLDTYRKLARQIKLVYKKTNRNITLICEIGHLQKKKIEKIFSFAKKIEFQKDLAGKWRVGIFKI